MHWSVLCDFDGTIAKLDSTDELLTQFALPEWKEIEELWVNGIIGSRECMRRQVELIRADLKEIDAFAETVAIESGFKEFISFCNGNGIPFTIVSDGIDYLIQRILLSKGIHNIPLVANRLLPTSGSTYSLESPYMNAGCPSGTCKCAVLRDKDRTQCLYIGDGRSDFCISSNAADLVIAKSSLLAHCRQESIPHVKFKSFMETATLLSSLITTPYISASSIQMENSYAAVQ